MYEGCSCCLEWFLKVLFRLAVRFIFSVLVSFKLSHCHFSHYLSDPPDRPKNISCINKVISEGNGVVFCTWNHGRDTYLRNSAVLWWALKGKLTSQQNIYLPAAVTSDFVCFRVRTLSGNYTTGPFSYSVPKNPTVSPSASFAVSSSVEFISVWVQTKNQLGSIESLPINYSLSDIGKTAVVSVWQVLELSSNLCSVCYGWCVMKLHRSFYHSATVTGTWTWKYFAARIVKFMIGAERVWELVMPLFCLSFYRSEEWTPLCV